MKAPHTGEISTALTESSIVDPARWISPSERRVQGHGDATASIKLARCRGATLVSVNTSLFTHLNLLVHLLCRWVGLVFAMVGDHYKP